MLARRNELAVCRTLVRVGGGVWRRKHQLTGFKLLEPGAQLERLTGLLANIHDPDYVTRHIDFTNCSNGRRICPEPSTSGASSTCSSTTNWLAACSSSTEAGELVGRRLSDLHARGHQGPHHTARAGVGIRRPGLDSSRAHIARAGRCRTHCPELTAAHSSRSEVLVQRGFQAIGPVAVSASRHAKLGGQLARETVTRNG
jgi:hypothetical protein